MYWWKWDLKVNVPGKIDMSIDTIRSGLTWNLDANNSIEYGFAYADQRRKQQTDDDSGYHPLGQPRHQRLLPVSADGTTGAFGPYKTIPR